MIRFFSVLCIIIRLWLDAFCALCDLLHLFLPEAVKLSQQLICKKNWAHWGSHGVPHWVLKAADLDEYTNAAVPRKFEYKKNSCSNACDGLRTIVRWSDTTLHQRPSPIFLDLFLSVWRKKLIEHIPRKGWHRQLFTVLKRCFLIATKKRSWDWLNGCKTWLFYVNLSIFCWCFCQLHLQACGAWGECCDEIETTISRHFLLLCSSYRWMLSSPLSPKKKKKIRFILI